MISEIKAIGGMAKELNEFQKYWRKYKGEEVIIRETSIESRADRSTETGLQVSTTATIFYETEYIIKGTVEDVRSLPPSFTLVEVTEELYDWKFVLKNGKSDQLDEEDWEKTVEGGTIRETEEKTISFSAIDELEPVKPED